MIKKWVINGLTDETAMEWANKPCWAWGEVLWLMAGLAPEAVNTTDYIPDMGAYGRDAEALVRAVDAKSLVQSGIDKYGVAIFKPTDIVRFAKAANFESWEYWESVFAAKNGASRGASQEPKGEATPAKTWQDAARQIADECYAVDTASSCRDSLRGYSERVMQEMQKRGIHGPRGRIDNPATIQREALQGKNWWKDKAK